VIVLRKFIAWFFTVGCAMVATQALCAHEWGTMVVMILCTFICTSVAISRNNKEYQ
jgi:bacteriorhodopsin